MWILDVKGKIIFDVQGKFIPYQKINIFLVHQGIKLKFYKSIMLQKIYWLGTLGDPPI